MRWPDFILIGAMKAGTTTLAAQLARHPGIFMTTPKEPNYFTFWHDRGQRWYGSLFEGAPDGARCGEASTSYSKWPEYDAAPAIARTLPDVRLVYLVRDPLDRLRSHWQHETAHGREHRPFEVAVRSDDRYVAFSRYGTQLQRYLDHFPREQILVVTTDDLREDPGGLVRHIAGFVGTVQGEGTGPVPDLRENVSAEKNIWPGRLNRLRQFPALKTVYAGLPSPVMRLLQRRLRRPVDTVPAELPPAMEEELRDVFRQDLVALRPFLPDEWDAWGLLARA